MDGSIVIGVELKDAGFAAALERLRQAASQTAAGSLRSLTAGINSVTMALSKSSVAGGNWSKQLTNMFSKVPTGAAAVAPKMLAVGQRAGYQFVRGLLSVKIQSYGRTIIQKMIASMNPASFRAAGSRAGGQMAAGFKSWGSTLTALAKTGAASVKSAFGSGWYDLGYNVAAGIAKGIGGGSTVIQKAAVTAAAYALYWAKRALGIRSPSRVFREEVGRMIPAGIAEGISAGQPQTQTAMRQQADALVETARKNVIPALSRTVSGARQPVQAGGGGEMKISLDAPLYLDGRELARATARYTGRQLMWEAM